MAHVSVVSATLELRTDGLSPNQNLKGKDFLDPEGGKYSMFFFGAKLFDAFF